MTVNPEEARELVPTRLKFRPTLTLRLTIQEFLDGEKTKKLRPAQRRVTLFSTQNVGLDLGDGNNGSVEDMAADRVYAAAIKESHDYMFQLQKPVGMTDLEDTGIMLEFGLDFSTDSERSRVVGPPLFPEGFDEEVRLYTILSRERLLGKWSTDSAFIMLKYRMDELANPASAPLGMAVTAMELYHRWPQPSIDNARH